VVKVEVYQLPGEHRHSLDAFERWDDAVHKGEYCKVYDGERGIGYGFEDAFKEFILKLPAGFKGRGLLVSDVVAIDGTACYCDPDGFFALDNFFWEG